MVCGLNHYDQPFNFCLLIATRVKKRKQYYSSLPYFYLYVHTLSLLHGTLPYYYPFLPSRSGATLQLATFLYPTSTLWLPFHTQPIPFCTLHLPFHTLVFQQKANGQIKTLRARGQLHPMRTKTKICQCTKISSYMYMYFLLTIRSLLSQ